MNKFTQLLFVLIAISCFTFSCSKETTIGSDILEQDNPNILFTDTLTFTTSMEAEDPVLIYQPNQPISINYLWRYFSDPIFGNVQSDIYTQFRINANTYPSFLDAGATLDSLVLFLELDSAGIYGDLSCLLYTSPSPRDS